ncbi:alpha-(1,6)-fucosyltransferase-like [Ixodes scapularis]
MSISKKRACPSTRALQSLLAATMIGSQRRKFGSAAIVVVFVALVHFMIPRSARNHWPWQHQCDFSRHRIDKNVFDFDMLTRTEERYAAMLQKLQATIIGLRDFQIYHLQTLAGKKHLATLSKSRDFLRSMELDIKNIKDLVGVKQSTASNLLKLQSYVQERIHTLQNPSDCGRSPKLRCVLDNPSGAGAGIHDLLWCFVAALRMGRTVVLDSSRWHYAPGEQWGKTFLPVAAPSCSSTRMNNTIEKGYPGNRSSGPDERSQILDLPSTIVEPLVGNHGSPYAWWYGQIVSYAFRLQNSTLQKIRKLKAALGYIHPIVGVHIRRTDKNGEAAYHSVEEYMTHVEEYYARLLLTTSIKRKRVFVATDERRVVAEIRKK